MKTDPIKGTASKAPPSGSRKRATVAAGRPRKDKPSPAKGAPAPSKSTLAASPRYGGPLALPLGLIEEDPHQPRTDDNPGFSAQSIAELAATIQLRGVKSPISVRDHPTKPGRYLINHGARRFRASRVAGKTTIPAFVDNDYNEVDQVIENLQRNELTAREIADYIGRELAKGLRQNEIARSIGKSPAFVTQHINLLDLPEPIAHAFNAGHVSDVTTVNELVTAYKKNPLEVADWLEDNEGQDITRSAVKLLRAFLEEKRYQTHVFSDMGVHSTDDDVPAGEDSHPEAQPLSQHLGRPVLQVRHQRRPAQLLWHRRPVEKGFAWLKYDDTGEEVQAPLAEVKLVALL
ncbi:MAG TPA: ParB/RepB/Spo0J family partition protein [Noviherbaspirillum sp.]